LRNTDQRSSVWEALFFRAKGDAVAARQAAAAGVTASQATLRQQPDNPKELAQLALLHALLGENESAWSEYRRASELIPDSRDAFQGTDVAIYGPRIHAVLGERTQALAGLQQTLRSFSYESAASVATDLAFAAWWDEPDFKAIVTDPANDALLQ
jgi:tetratricopeptide (TPR) repeat protein